MKKFKDVAHMYIGCFCQDSFNDFKVRLTYKNLAGYMQDSPDDLQIKPILRPIDELTRDDFMEFATSEMMGRNDSMAFSFQDENWRAAAYDKAELNYDDDQEEIISATEEDGPENVLMLHVRTKIISDGWLLHDETYSGCSIDRTARWIAFLCSKGYDVFNLIKSGEAIKGVRP